MSSTVLKDGSPSELFFQNVNGCNLKLIDESAKNKNVMKFMLYKDIHFNANVTFLLLFLTLVLWRIFNIVIPFAGSLLILILQYICFITSVKKDTLTIVQSVGIYTEGKRIFCGVSSCNFVPWDTVVDVIINEVITGGTILPYNYSERIGRWKRFDKTNSFIPRVDTREKMPGIYVRETSWIDWKQQKKNPVLTVPGSYWLYHKHNIYKFIFRYHRTIRDVKHFNYGKELMKIIRRIIKNLPRQGQQFSTNNLLVTYNHTSWTRQDKIFAMTKFKERSAAAFSHAFVLTIKLVSLLENSEQVIKYDVTNCSDQPLSWSNNELVHSLNNELPEHSKRCGSSEEKAFEQKNDNQLDNNITLNTISKKSTNKEPVNKKMHSKDFNKLQLSVAFNELSKNVSINKENNCTITDKHSTLVTVKENRLISNLLEDINILEIETTENKDCDNKADKGIIKNDTSESDNIEVDSTNVDSANLPYQYLIEREIEDAKLNTIHPKVSLLNSKKRKRQDVSEQCSTASVDLFTNVSEAEESDSCIKRRRAPDNVTPRSSDITDLVMEGLMFTIRQGQDTVAVIEQKTKFELDEVLENSEKIETGKGEKCLRNSSLLGLENLITMIESPKETEARQKPKNLVLQENTTQYQNTRKCMFNNANYFFEDTYFSNTCLNKNSNNTNKNQNTEMYGEDFELTENESLQYKKENEESEDEDEDEDEDIIPEALQDSFFEPSVLSFKKTDESAVDKDLLMDDTNAEISTEFEVTVKQDHLFGKKHKLQHEGVTNNRTKTNVPIIISNEIISTNQIPLPLQKLLQNKWPRTIASVNRTNEMEKKNILDNKLLLLESKNLSCNIHPASRSSNCNILDSTQSLENPQTSISSNNETRNRDASFLLLEEEYGNSDITRNRLKGNEDELQKHSVNVNKEEQLSSCKLQDITPQFYQDILYLERKKNLSNQQLNLRSRKKSINMLQEPSTRDANIEMIKFVRDITNGAKVVITRMSTKSIHSIIGKNS